MVIHPDDDNGDVLRRMEAKGDDLRQARDIDFTVVFAGEDAAVHFAEHFRGQGYKVSVRSDGPATHFPWDVLVVRHMVPDYEEIGKFETALQEIAETLGGRNDGWGCFTLPRLM